MFCATAVVPALGQSTLIFQHSGATDPLTEGFDKALAPGNGYPVINDMGANAWVTPGISNLNVFYSYVLTPQQQAESAGAGWTLSADLRITTTNSYPIFSCSWMVMVLDTGWILVPIPTVTSLWITWEEALLWEGELH